MEHKMVQALENGEFIVYYQPIYQIKPLLLVGLEALLRMQTKKFGLVLPVQFIPELEQSGFILQVGQWMLETVCGQMEQWQTNGVGTTAVSVNMSDLQFRTPQLVSSLRQHLDAHQLLPQFLPVEIKEKALTPDWIYAQQAVNELRNAGVPIIVDNYGTGEVPLQQLAEAGIFQVKLDISLMKALVGDPQALTRVQAIVRQAQQLQMRVIAKGVESDSQLKLLEGMECAMAQGFFLGEPLPAKTIPVLLKAQHSKS
jgi:EAL domain-containing protein (putative c-di-GMP-specific phosphodiesterase class I)